MGIECSELEAVAGFRAVFPKRLPSTEEDEAIDLSAFPISLGDLMRLYDYISRNTQMAAENHGNLATTDQEQVCCNT